jgi:hypothetical protein
LHFVGERREGAEEKALGIIKDGLDKAGWADKDLVRRPKGEPWKMEMASRLRTETTLKWIAERLQTGSWKDLNGRLYEHRMSARNQNTKCPISRN